MNATSGSLAAVILVGFFVFVSLQQFSKDPTILPTPLSSCAIDNQRLHAQYGGARETATPNIKFDQIRNALSFAEDHTTIVVVGCNKGVDAIDMLSAFDSDYANGTAAKQWRDEIRAHVADRECAHACAEPPRFTLHRRHRSATIHCIEPMPVNYKLLKTVRELTKVSETKFQIHHAAIGASNHPPTVQFADTAAGVEAIGIGRVVKGKPMVPVAFTSIDKLAAQSEMGPVKMLLVDAEGHDPLVIFGAATTLTQVQYLEFEVHRDLIGTPWADIPIKYVIQYLDNFGFTCYWPFDNAPLIRITHCWHPAYDSKINRKWGNIVCAKRGTAAGARLSVLN